MLGWRKRNGYRQRATVARSSADLTGSWMTELRSSSNFWGRSNHDARNRPRPLLHGRSAFTWHPCPITRRLRRLLRRWLAPRPCGRRSVARRAPETLRLRTRRSTPKAGVANGHGPFRSRQHQLRYGCADVGRHRRGDIDPDINGVDLIVLALRGERFFCAEVIHEVAHPGRVRDRSHSRPRLLHGRRNRAASTIHQKE